MRVLVDGVSLWFDVMSPAVVAEGDRMVERPVLVGAEDPAVPVAVMRAVRARLVNAPTRLVVLPDCGHTVFRDQPDLAHTAIREFLAEVGS